MHICREDVQSFNTGAKHHLEATRPHCSISTIDRSASSEKDQMCLPFIKWLAGVCLAQQWLGNGQNDSKPDMLQRPKPLITVKVMPNLIHLNHMLKHSDVAGGDL